MIALWFGVGLAHGQVEDLQFTSEHAMLGASPAVVRDEGLLVELQTHWMPQLRSPTGLAVVPVVPRLGVGVAGIGDDVRWSAMAHGFGIVPIDGADQGGGAGLTGGFTLGVPQGRIRAGLEAKAQVLSFRSFDDTTLRWTLGADLVAGYDIGRATVSFRAGAISERTRSDTVRLGVRTITALEPRMGLAVAVHPADRWTLSLALRSGVRHLIPRVPFTAVLGATFQIRGFSPD